MSSAADLGGIFMVIDVVTACFCTNYKYEKDRTFGDGVDSDSSEEATGHPGC